jgi:hypothetical protein
VPQSSTALSPRFGPGSVSTTLASATPLARSGPIRQQRAHLLARRRRTRCATAAAARGRAATTGEGPPAATRVRGGEVAVEQRDLHLRGRPLLPVVLQREEHRGAHVEHLARRHTVKGGGPDQYLTSKGL